MMKTTTMRLLFLSCVLGCVIGLAANHFYRDVRPQRVSIRVDMPPPPPNPYPTPGRVPK